MATQARRKAQRNRNKNKFSLWGLVAIVLIGLLAIFWLLSQSGTTANQYPLEVSVEEALAKREAGAFILDVRQPEEWNEFHVPGSTLIPLDRLAARVNELPRDQEIVVVCRSGNRSVSGRDILLEAGFTQATSMAGGLTQWKAAGYPTVSGP